VGEPIPPEEPVDIGPPRRTIDVEPISVPLPVELPETEPAPVEPQPQPVEPSR